MKTATHGNGKCLNDLYILPDDAQEARKIRAYLNSRQIRHHWSYSDVEGQEWYGRVFLEIPFGEGYLDVIQQQLQEVQA